MKTRSARTIGPWTWVLVLTGVMVLGASTPVLAELPYEGAPINYLTAKVDDPIARLGARLKSGEAKLIYDEKQGGYLASLLKALAVPESSQVLVFSKTSFQRHRISPRTPRALYFGDDIYVGWVQGGDVVEISSVDPRQGAVFYLLDQDPAGPPRFQRLTHDCLQCHSSGKTQEVPGHLVRSVYPDRSGQPMYNAGTFTTSHESPMNERWGGWYVTGTHGKQTHMGNVFVTDPEQPEQLDTAAGANVIDLSKRFKTARYLEPTSDIVALMVMEHQTQMHNLITAASYHARLALHYQKGINQSLGRPENELSPSTLSRIKSPAEKLVRYMLFSGEPPLSEPVAGSSSFTRDFQTKGVRDPLSRSLRDLDLTHRMFRYPCSYLIYSEAFDSLPPSVLDVVYQRLLDVLTGKDQSPEFAHLSASDRAAILEILRATKKNLPAAWNQPTS